MSRQLQLPQLPLAAWERLYPTAVAAGAGDVLNRDAERIAARSRDARVIYGSDGRYDDRYGYPDRNRNGRDDRYEGRYPNGGYGYGVSQVPYRNGYQDGLEKGREDARDGDRYDPNRHSRYRSADHGYNNRYGSKNDYKLVYRDGFEAGYRTGYSDRRFERPDR